ncbi:vesicle transport protein Sec20 [Rhodnius prolixus]|uniref:vesicle transport protein Sec20 n=1 Tax=Rhodnius prolixus TaxID=13249 RepID=UPI003D189AAD
MDESDHECEQLQREITQTDLALKSLIQDIYNCTGSAEDLNALNAEGRTKLNCLRSLIDKLESFGSEKQNAEIQIAASNHREQYYSTYSMFRKANVASLLAIEKMEKDELYQTSGEVEIRNRKKKDKANLVKMSSGITEQLLSISRHLADTSKLSADTLDTLVNSSTTVSGTITELMDTRTTLSQSGKLLAKYSRRQLTDKFILFLGFALFFFCVLYIVKKRVF